jgi:phosphatidylinositol alpha-mannosyltransferase
MKIGIVTEYYYPILGGITENVYNTKIRLQKTGHEVKVITSNCSRRRFAGYGVRSAGENDVIRMGHTMRVYSNGSFAHVTVGVNLRSRLKEILADERFDILHVHSPAVVTLPILALFEARCPLIGTFHTYFENSLLYSLLNGKAQKHIDRLSGKIAVSRTTAEALEQYFKLNARIIPNGVDTDEFNPEIPPLEKFNDGTKNLLFLSRFDPRNGLRLMLRAFEIVKDAVPDVRLIIVGDGPLKSYYKRFVPRRVARDVHFEGLVRDARARYYASCDVFCSPVMKASFGVTLLEAMASGKPIVATVNRGYRELLGPDEGFLVPPNDPAAFARSIVKLLADEKLRNRMGANGRQKAIRFSWDTIVREITGYYDEILNGR